MSSSSDLSLDDQQSDQYATDRSETDSDVSSFDGASDAEDDRNDNNDVDITSVRFCATHKPGNMIRSCQSCSVALKMVSDRILVARLFGEASQDVTTTSSSTSGIRTRYGGRCDETVPTMSLSDDVLDTVADILGQGQFNGGRSMWNEIVKKHLVLPQPQHEKLSGDLKSEDIFNKFRKLKKFQYVFKYQGEVRDCLKNFRLSERPIFSVVDLLNTELSSIRKFGEEIGFSYPKVPPPRDGANVPRDRGSGTTTDSLKFISKANIIPCPRLIEFLDNAHLDRDIKEEIFDLVEEYRESVGDKIVRFYNSVADTLNKMDDFLIFHFDLFSHVNASMKELLRAKLASLFKGDVRDEILQSIKKADKSSNGIFGGISYTPNLFSF